MESYFSVEIIHNLRYGFKDTINPLQLFIFTKVIHYSRLPLWVGYFIYFKFTCVSSIVYKCYIFSSVKETNLLINKGMCSFIWCFFKHLLLRKTDVLKTCWKISQKENLKKCTSFEEQKGSRYIQENVYFGIIIFSCLLSTKPCLRFLLNCCVRKIKGFYQSSLGNEVDFRDIMNVSPDISAKN